MGSEAAVEVEHLCRGHVILVGFMGTGKSAVGRRLARRLHRPFLDTDEWIVREAGMSIPAIFAEHGEPTFRELEARAVQELQALPPHVISTGGGILGRAANGEGLRRTGVLVGLTARPEVILARTRRRQDRPLLRGAADPQARIVELLHERATWYAQADLTVDTSDLSVGEVVELICRELPSLSAMGGTIRSTWAPESCPGPANSLGAPDCGDGSA